MGKTFRTARPIPADLNTDPEQPVKESTLRRFAKALKKITHHRERRSVRTATMKEMEEAI